jgi:hypothetical protein
LYDGLEVRRTLGSSCREKTEKIPAGSQAKLSHPPSGDIV